MNAPGRSLLRFVQLKRLGPPRDEDCTTAASVIDALLDFRGACSDAVKEALGKGDRDAATALYASTLNGLSDDGRAVGKIALRFYRLASLNDRLTVGQARSRRQQWATSEGLPTPRLKRGLDALTAWVIDLLMLQRWLDDPATAVTPEMIRTLRGIVLLRVLDSSAGDACLLRQLLAGKNPQLPTVPSSPPDSDPAPTLEAQRYNARRILKRARAVKPDADPTIADLTPAAFPDMAAATTELQRTAASLGLAGTTKVSAFQRVLDEEAADSRRTRDRAETRARTAPGGMTVSAGTLAELPNIGNMIYAEAVLPVFVAEARVLGRGDLMIIRTEHLRYQPSDISHIENVLASEVRERTHAIETSTSETITESSESMSETTQELETTEQNSLERATATASSTGSNTSLGVSVSGGLGPVRAGLDVNTSLSTSTSSSNSSAVSYAKDVTERAAETLRTETGYKRTTVSRTRVTETNLHKFDNSAAGAANIAGIYHWIDKVDRAQVFNYGERLMLEFIVPEPAAQFVYLKQAGTVATAPVPPEEFDFEVDDVRVGNYVEKAARWNVIGLEPPPAKEVFASTSVIDPAAKGFDYTKNTTDEAQPEWGYANYTSDVHVPEGYAASIAYVSVTWTLVKGEYDSASRNSQSVQAVQVAVGGQKIIINDDNSSDVHRLELEPVVAGPLPVAISSDQRGGSAITVRVLCLRTEDALDAWKLRTYETIRAGYLEQKAAYDRDLKLYQTKQSYSATTSPDTNRQIELAELKRGCQTILTGQDFDLFGALTLSSDEAPRIDRSEAHAEASAIQFFEDCFEWENLTYLFYPYQWAGRDRWLELAGRSSTDLLHQAFLQAGSARVVVPVREGYERAIGEYLATSIVPEWTPTSWRGGKSPYPPIDELIADANERPGPEVPIGDPWEVVTPTTLVYLQVGGELNPKS